MKKLVSIILSVVLIVSCFCLCFGRDGHPQGLLYQRVLHGSVLCAAERAGFVRSGHSTP